MFLIVAVLVIAVVLAALVTAFAAYPHRGEPLPHAERLSRVLMKANEKMRL